MPEDISLPRVEVDMQLSFALHAAANRMVRLHKPFLEPLGLTFPQYLVLLELFTRAPRTVGELGAKVDMDAGTITPLLKRLEVGGKVTRQRDSSDERRVLVDLTPAGEALRDAVWTVTKQIETACAMSEADLVALRETLDRLAWPVSHARASSSSPAAVAGRKPE